MEFVMMMLMIMDDDGGEELVVVLPVLLPDVAALDFSLEMCYPGL